MGLDFWEEAVASKNSRCGDLARADRGALETEKDGSGHSAVSCTLTHDRFRRSDTPISLRRIKMPVKSYYLSDETYVIVFGNFQDVYVSEHAPVLPTHPAGSVTDSRITSPAPPQLLDNSILVGCSPSPQHIIYLTPVTPSPYFQYSNTFQMSPFVVVLPRHQSVLTPASPTAIHTISTTPPLAPRTIHRVYPRVQVTAFPGPVGRAGVLCRARVDMCRHLPRALAGSADIRSADRPASTHVSPDRQALPTAPGNAPINSQTGGAKLKDVPRPQKLAHRYTDQPRLPLQRDPHLLPVALTVLRGSILDTLESIIATLLRLSQRAYTAV
ncbi:hypothetical protein DFH09DRAFT_1097313 [Mycena vulgaris]|nr:hypothetical protein DFH09DRAFT_1097313 [Mycena vulgaris]